MGRRKVEIKRIEKKSSRQVTFSKRRNGLIEKARQISILCDSSVAVLVVSASGKLYNSSSGDNMSNIIHRYEIQHADELKALDLAEKIRNYLPNKELLELVQSNLEEPNVGNVSVDSLISVEEQLETALSATRARKTELMMELVKTLQEKEKLLIEENQVLASQEKLLIEENQVLLAIEKKRCKKVPYRWGGTCHQKITPATTYRRLSRFSSNHHDSTADFSSKLKS